MTRRGLVPILGAIAALSTTSANADTAPDYGRPFSPQPVSQPVYEAPTEPDAGGHRITMDDGTELFLDVWLPVRRDGGPAVPSKLPTVLIATPYSAPGFDLHVKSRPAFNRRGFAVAYLNLRGTGASEGCWDFNGKTTAKDVETVIRWIGESAEWSDDTVAMYGMSSDADSIIATVSLGNDRPEELKAAAFGAGMSTPYELDFFDGGNMGPMYTVATWAVMGPQNATGIVPGTPRVDPEYVPCAVEQGELMMDQSGDFNTFWQSLDYRPGASQIDLPMIVSQGMADEQTEPTDLFRLIPESTPTMGVFGWWEHGVPSPAQNVKREQARADWFDLVTAWFDRHMHGADTGTDRWPRVQVQGSDGQWRAERAWPATGGPIGTLALSSGGKLGAALPTGSSAYTEGYGKLSQPLELANDPTGTVESPDDPTTVVFETPALTRRLQITGRPVLDLWVTLDRPDAAMAARLEIIDLYGNVERYHANVGLRSAQHLEPFGEKGYFTQSESRPADTGDPIRVPVRFDSADLVVPAGGKLRLTVAGSVPNGNYDRHGGPEDPLEPFFYTSPSGAGTTVTIHHDCAHPSVLRFQLPAREPDLLDVQDVGEEPPTAISPPFKRRVVESTGGGLATTPVCGAAPVPPERLLRTGG